MTLIAGGRTRTMPEVEFFVAGVPGSRAELRGPVFVTANAFPGGRKFEGPVRLMVEFYFEKPRGVFEKHHTDKPDLGDLAQVVVDTLCGIFWLDNRQVCTLVVVKGYAETPGTGIKVTAVDEPRRKGVGV